VRLLSDIELRREFGDPSPFIREDGTVKLDWERDFTSTCKLPAPLALSWSPTSKVTTLRCHRRLVGLFESALDALWKTPEAWATIGDTGGIYAFRVRRTDHAKLSLHAWGAAIDLDVRDNPLGDTTPEVHPKTIAIMASHGFAWGGPRSKGGFFSDARPDPMHFECSDVTLHLIGGGE